MPIDWRSPRATYVLLDVDGTQFDFFREYSVEVDLMNPGSEFHFSASHIPGKRGVRESLGSKGLAPGRKVALRLVTPYGTTLQHTGRIYDVIYDTTKRGGSIVQVVVRSAMYPIVHADALPHLGIENITFADMIRSIAAPFGFAPSDITVDADAARNVMTGKPAPGVSLSGKAPLDIETMKIDQAMPNAGENAFSFLRRHAQRFGLMIWETADGKIVCGRPNYDQKPRYALRARQGIRGSANNVKQIRRRISFAQRPSEVHVYGRTAGGDYSRSAVHEVVHDREVEASGIYAPIVVHDNNVKDPAQARERAEWELGRRRQTADVVSVLLRGHCANDGTVYAIDTIADVAYDICNLDGSMYVVRRGFHATRTGGTETTLELVPKYAIALGDGIVSAPAVSKFDASRNIDVQKAIENTASKSAYDWLFVGPVATQK